jgi:hypothetical protein
MDNVAFHHSNVTVAAVHSKGCHTLYTLPYSPCLNAIEYAFSSIKTRYRRSCPAGSHFAGQRRSGGAGGCRRWGEAGIRRSKRRARSTRCCTAGTVLDSGSGSADVGPRCQRELEHRDADDLRDGGAGATCCVPTPMA